MDQIKREDLIYPMNHPVDRHIEFIKKQLDTHPFDADLWQELGETYLYDKEEYDSALQAFEYGSALLPDEVLFFVKKGMCLLYQDKVEEAITLFHEYYLKTSDLVNAYFWIGTCHHWAGDNESAIPYFREVIKEDPLHIDSYISITTILTSEQRFDQAIEIIQHLQAINPQEEEINFLMLHLYMEKRELEPLVHWYHRVIAIDPDFEKEFIEDLQAEAWDDDFIQQFLYKIDKKL